MQKLQFYPKLRIINAYFGIINVNLKKQFCVIIKTNVCLEMIAIYTFRYKQIGRKIAYYRQLSDLTQELLANRANISVSSLSKIERGKYNKNLSLSMLFCIAASLNIEVTSLLTFSDEEKRKQN